MSVIKTEFKGSLLQSSVSHDSSEIILIFWFDAQETFLIIINVETVLLLHIFVQTVIYFQDSLINSSKEQLLFINVFTVFEQWMHPCWIEVLISLKIHILLTPNLYVVL